MARSDASTIAVRPALLEDRAGVWPLARDFATSFVVREAEFAETFEALISAGCSGPDASAGSLLLVAVAPSPDEVAVISYATPTARSWRTAHWPGSKRSWSPLSTDAAV